MVQAQVVAQLEAKVAERVANLVADQDTQIEAKVAMNVSNHEKAQMQWFKKLELLLGRELPPLPGYHAHRFGSSAGESRFPSTSSTTSIKQAQQRRFVDYVEMTYARFSCECHDVTQLNIPTHQMNTKFVNNLPAYWGKYVTNVKQNMDISTTPYVQIYTHLKAYEPHAKKTLKKQSSNPTVSLLPDDALLATMTQNCLSLKWVYQAVSHPQQPCSGLPQLKDSLATVA
ncbi:hypothetical protein Tco_0872460 [Tanacetum coccineum]